MKHQHTWKNKQIVAYQRIYFFTFSIINISNFFFKMTVWIEKIYFFSFLWYKSSFYNLYFDSWKYEEKRRDQFNDSPTMPEPRHIHITKNYYLSLNFFFSLLDQICFISVLFSLLRYKDKNFLHFIWQFQSDV